MSKRAKKKDGVVTPVGTDEKPASGKSSSGKQSSVAEWTKSLLVAGGLFLLLRSFIVQTFVITSGSMEDTLLVGDMLMVNRAAIGSFIPFTPIRIPGYSEARRGDVLVFDPPHEPDLKLVKRLIGLPGDTLEMRNRVLFLNGEMMDEAYLRHSDVRDEMDPRMSWQAGFLAPGIDPASYAPTRDTWGPIVIPEDRYFMLGDNRETSLDSRYWGMIEGWRLEGRAVFIYFSYNWGSYRAFPAIFEIRWGRLGQGID